MKDPKDAFGVVMLTPAAGGKKRTPKQRVIEQRGREFAPHLMAVPVGSTVAFPNFDDIYHNVFSRSKSQPFDLGIYKNGQARELTFDREGIVRVGCNLHANMARPSSWSARRTTPSPTARARFRFRSLEPGKYTLRAWSERSARAGDAERSRWWRREPGSGRCGGRRSARDRRRTSSEPRVGRAP